MSAPALPLEPFGMAIDRSSSEPSSCDATDPAMVGIWGAFKGSLLTMFVTFVLAFAAAAVIDHDPTLTDNTMLWLAAIITLWSPLIILAVTAPLEWIISYAKADDASDQALNADPQFSSFEDTTVRIAVLAWIAATTATLIHATRTNSGLAPSLVAIGLSIIGLVIAFARWDGRRSLRRLVHRPR